MEEQIRPEHQEENGQDFGFRYPLWQRIQAVREVERSQKEVREAQSIYLVRR